MGIFAPCVVEILLVSAEYSNTMKKQLERHEGTFWRKEQIFPFSGDEMNMPREKDDKRLGAVDDWSSFHLSHSFSQLCLCGLCVCLLCVWRCCVCCVWCVCGCCVCERVSLHSKHIYTLIGCFVRVFMFRL